MMQKGIPRRESPPSVPPKARARQESAGPRPAALPVAGGEALPRDLRAEFEGAFDADFSNVRLHTDGEAGAAALALGARAFSLGRDIVFAPRHYAPDTVPGRALIAHELCHVAQDGGIGPSPGEPLRIDPTDSPHEREADQAACLVAAGCRPRLPTGRSRGGSAVLHRSLLGSIVGAAGGALLGSLLGPVGLAVGLVAGAALGDVLTRRSRRLTGDEKAYLKVIYQDSVDYDRVTITRGAALSTFSATTTGNTINLEGKSKNQDYLQFKGDTMELTEYGLTVLAHEMGHVWQYQNAGLAYIPLSLIAQLRTSVTSGDRDAAYNWGAMVERKIDWAYWNPEQQAECLSDYNEALRRSIARGTNSDGSDQELADNAVLARAKPYVDLVRARIGAPRLLRGIVGAIAAPSTGTVSP